MWVEVHREKGGNRGVDLSLHPPVEEKRFLFVDQAQGACLFDGLHAGLHAQFAVDIVDMGLDRAECHSEAITDLTVGESLVNKSKHFQFAGTEAARSRRHYQ